MLSNDEKYASYNRALTLADVQRVRRMACLLSSIVCPNGLPADVYQSIVQKVRMEA